MTSWSRLFGPLDPRSLWTNDPRATAFVTAMRLLDVPVFLVAIYFAFDATALAAVGVYSVHRAVLTNLAAALAITAMVRITADRGWRWPAYLLGPAVLGVGARIIVGILNYSFTESTQSGWYGWFPTEFHHLPMVWGGAFRGIWPYTPAYFSILLALFLLRASGRPLVLVAFNALSLVGLGAYIRAAIPDDFQLMVLPIPAAVLAIVFGVLRQPVLERRFASISMMFVFVVSLYVCLVPVAPTVPAVAGLTRMYPKAGHRPVVSMVHLRDAVVDERAGRTIFAWGRTCGLVDVDEPRGTETVLDTDMMRFLSSDPATGAVFGATFVTGDYLEFNGRPLRLVRRASLYPFGMGQLMMALQHGDDIYVSSLEPPGIARLNRETLRPAAIRHLSPEYTRMRTILGVFVLSPDGSRVYLEMLTQDATRRGRILELDGTSLAVLRTLDLPEPTWGIAYDGTHRRLLLAGGYTDQIYEVGLDRFEVLGGHPGVVFARFFVLDERRDWIIAGGFYSGDLVVIDRTTFATLFTAHVARRINNGHLNESGDLCYFTSTEGLYRLDLNALAASLGRPAAPSASH